MEPVTIRKLSQEEAARHFPGRGTQNLSDYMAALGGLEPGEAVEVNEEGVSVRTLKRRLTTAAKQIGVRLKYAKDTEGRLRFMVLQAATPAPRRRGRPRKFS